MKKYFLLVASFLLLTSPKVSFAKTVAVAPKPTATMTPTPLPSPVKAGYDLAKVVETKDEEVSQDLQTGGLGQALSQVIKAELLSGSEKGKVMELMNGQPLTIPKEQKIVKGDVLVLETTKQGENVSYMPIDKYRIRALIILTVVFVLAVVVFAGIKGIGSVIGFGSTVLVLGMFIVPRLVSGQNPIAISFLGACLIASISMFLSHGFGYRTRIAYFATIFLLALSLVLSKFFVGLVGLSGMGSEDAFFLQTGFNININMRGLLLGGIIIGVLGVLDDITTAQVAAVDEIHKANPKLDFKELYKRGTSVGKEHIASLVNTLLLAYAGSSLPLFLLFTLNNNQPMWLTLNSEFIAEEVVRTLIGSLVLVLAVPVSTLLAAWMCSRKATSKVE